VRQSTKGKLRCIGEQRAKRRECPQCHRGAAMRRIKDANGINVARRCWWCGYTIPLTTDVG
jgi:hypothetical protein